MVFSSVIFLFWFLPIFLFLYKLADARYKNAVILIGSIAFYAWGAPNFIFVVLATSFIDFHFVAAMHRASTERARRSWLLASLGLNLGLLGYFKYSNFFVENVNASLGALGGGSIGWVEVALPLGISFFIFESLTYVIDVYRGVHAPLRHFWEYQMYILYFPKLIAGPIVRYHEIAEQITQRQESSELLLTGFYRFCIGLAKKVLIANKLGAIVAHYYGSDATQLSAGQAWLGLLGFTLQIYFDFSGYSDMALGLSRMMGLRLPENFNNPFIAGSMTEFWQRWHISLGNWIRNYLFSPLSMQLRHYRRAGLAVAITVTFLASGLWHGAAWNFVIWGAFHGFWLVMDQLFLLRLLKRLGRLPGMLLVGFLVTFCFGIFKIEDLGHAQLYYGALFGGGSGIPIVLSTENLLVLATALIFAWFAAVPALQRFQDRVFAESQSTLGHLALFGLSAVLLLICASTLVWAPYNPFLYFRF
jgi:alginate O-acetyltransferase complex protein AlgI